MITITIIKNKGDDENNNNFDDDYINDWKDNNQNNKYK